MSTEAIHELPVAPEWRQKAAAAAARLVRESSLYLGLLAIFLIGWVTSPLLEDEQGGLVNVFLSATNQKDVLRAVSQNGLLAVGMTFVILTGGIDLSVGRLLGLASVLAAMLLVDNKWTAATYFTLPAAALAAGLLAAMLVRAAFAKKACARRDAVISAAAFVCVAALVLLWTIPQVGTGLSVWAVLLTVPLTGMLVGAMSGLIIARLRLQPFIVTLAMMITAFGAARLIASSGGAAYIHPLYDSEGNPPPGVDSLRIIDPGSIASTFAIALPARSEDWLRSQEAKNFFEYFPVPGAVFLVTLAIGMFILSRLRFGRYVYAIGGNEDTARLSGVNVDRVKTAVYAISGFLAFLAGVLNCAQYAQGKPEAGEMAELDAIAAVVIGGTSLMGGRGRMIGTLVGILIFGYLTNVLRLNSVSTDVQLFVTGIIILVAVFLQEGLIHRLPKAWRLRVALALLFAFGGLLTLLTTGPMSRPEAVRIALMYWNVLSVIACVLIVGRLAREWNWIDPLILYALCLWQFASMGWIWLGSAAGALTLVLAALLALDLSRQRRVGKDFA